MQPSALGQKSTKYEYIQRHRVGPYYSVPTTYNSGTPAGGTIRQSVLNKGASTVGTPYRVGTYNAARLVGPLLQRRCSAPSVSATPPSRREVRIRTKYEYELQVHTTAKKKQHHHHKGSHVLPRSTRTVLQLSSTEETQAHKTCSHALVALVLPPSVSMSEAVHTYVCTNTDTQIRTCMYGSSASWRPPPSHMGTPRLSPSVVPHRPAADGLFTLVAGGCPLCLPRCTLFRHASVTRTTW